MTAPREDERPGAIREPPLRLRKEVCRGCTHCLRVCPTEAIRVRRGKAEIVPQRCIYCGECMRVCPHEAWTVQGTSLPQAGEPRDRSRAVLDPAVFGQFGGSVAPGRVLQGFDEVGFPAAQEIAGGIEIYRRAVAGFLGGGNRAIPAISSDCPAVVQLVQVKFPSLLENLVPIVPPYEIEAERLKGSFAPGSPEGLYYIVPCPAKAFAALNPLSPRGGYSGAIPVSELYNSVKARLHAAKTEGAAPEDVPCSSRSLEWSMSGGESRALGIGATVVVDGIRHVAGVLELAENGLLDGVPFIEAWSCPGGCLGGPLNVQNPYWARFHLISYLADHPPAGNRGDVYDVPGEAGYRIPRPFQPREGMRLDPDLKRAMEKLRRIDEALKKFPGIDCGSCGCPNCLALAEDVVQGHASEKDCKFLPRGTGQTSKKERKGFRDGNEERND